jgi:hypothetical protein
MGPSMERLLELLSLNFQMAKSPKEARLQMYKCQAKKEFQLLKELQSILKPL